MSKVDRYNPTRMFNQGCAFCDIAELCIKEPNAFKERTQSHFIGRVSKLFISMRNIYENNYSH